jgi:acetoin utilization protein AcuB
MKVRDRMNRDPVVLAPGDNLRKARQLIAEHGFRRFPVLDNGILVGVVTDRDVRNADMSSAILQEKKQEDYVLDKVQIGGIMTRDPITIAPDAPLIVAAAIILKNKIGGLPVVEEGRLVGIITETDLIATLIDLLEKK